MSSKDKEVCFHREEVCDHCKEKFHATTEKNCYRLLCNYCFYGWEREPQKKPEKKEDSLPCQHAEDVCHYCLDKVQKTTEDSPRKDNLSSGAKLLLFPAVSSFLVVSGALWVISTKMLLTAAKIGLKLIGSPSE